MKTCVCGRKNITLTKRVKAKIIKDLSDMYTQDDDEDEEISPTDYKKSLSKSLNSVGDIMEWMRDYSWDLWEHCPS